MLVDRDWVIGSGVYDANVEDPFIRRAETTPGSRKPHRGRQRIGRVRRAHGRDAALREFNDPNGDFVRGGSLRLRPRLQWDEPGAPFRPELVGTDRSGARDSLGVNYTRVQSLLAQQGGGFLYYRYPNPAHNMTPESKMSYVAPVDDAWYVGRGSTRSLRTRAWHRSGRARGRSERTAGASRSSVPGAAGPQGLVRSAGHPPAVRPAPAEVRGTPGSRARPFTRPSGACPG